MKKLMKSRFITCVNILWLLLVVNIWKYQLIYEETVNICIRQFVTVRVGVTHSNGGAEVV